MEIISGNNLNLLAQKFALNLVADAGDVFARRPVIVQSMGMQRWLAMRVSDCLGICANLNFLFPNQFMHQTVGALCNYDESLLDACSRDANGWRLMAALPEVVRQPEFKLLRQYLQDDIDNPSSIDRKLYQLAFKLADLYDQYALFRPDWMQAWAAATPAKLEMLAGQWADEQERQTYLWQAALWRQVLQPHSLDCQWPFLQAKLAELLEDSLFAPKLPETVDIFGVSYLPPMYVDILHQLSQRINVRMYILNPCEKYWADILSPRQQRRIQKEFTEEFPEVALAEIRELSHTPNPNRLLANWGLLGRQLFKKLWMLESGSEEYFVAPGYDNILHTLQSDILTMTDRGPDADDADETALPFYPYDKSLQVHVCHGTLREIEVLHDNLLEMFAGDLDLRPEDIVVIAPNIDAYEAQINAVFGSRGANNTRLPYSISDRLPLRQGLTAAFFMLLDINKTRFEADKVMELLEIEPVRASFGIKAHDLAQIERWLRESGIRWGLDYEHKAKSVGISYFEPPADFGVNTWEYGLQRLLLSCAMPAGLEPEAFKDVLGIAGMAYDQKELLGNLLSFLHSLKHYYEVFMQLHEPASWQQIMLDYLNTFFKNEALYAEKEQLQQAMAQMTRYAALAEFTKPLHLEVIAGGLRSLLESGGFERGFLSRGITFCSAKPMRSIPFKVVCFLGMDLDGFPARENVSGFDLMARDRKPGDRSKRLDDRYLFLEALVSARDIFYVSYTGYNQTDSTAVPPSVLLSELLEVTERSFLASNSGGVLEQVVTRHKMHGFDSAYFTGDDKLFSYNLENFTVAQNAAQVSAGFMDAILPLSHAEEQTFSELTPYEFARFFSHPVRAFLQQRLNVNLNIADEELNTLEPMEVTGLEGYALKRALTDLMLSPAEPRQMLTHLSRAGLLPHGSLAVKTFSDNYQDLWPFTQRIRSWLDELTPGVTPEIANIDIYIDKLHIKGALPLLTVPTGDHARPQRQVYFSWSDDKAQHKFTAWLYHLLAAQAGIGDITDFIDRGRRFCFRPVQDASLILETMERRYWQALSEPLAFFPVTAWAYCEQLQSKDDAGAQKACLGKWRGSAFGGAAGEMDDLYNRLCFAEEFGEELPPPFFEIAIDIMKPLFLHMDKAGEGA